MDINRPQRSPIKNIEKKYNTNYYFNIYSAIIVSIITTINFAYLLKYFNFNEC